MSLKLKQKVNLEKNNVNMSVDEEMIMMDENETTEFDEK